MEIMGYEANENIEKAAQFNDPKAFQVLGDMNYLGIGNKQNFEEAVKNYPKAANLNNSRAYLRLGDMYLSGKGVEKDLIKGRKYLEYSAQLNNSEALHRLGDFYSSGDAFDTDVSKAIKYLNKYKENRFVTSKIHKFRYNATFISKDYNNFFYRSMNDLGLIYLTVFDDIEKAIDNIKESAFGEYPFAQNNYGLLYQFYFNNLENAEHFYKRSSEHQFALAEYNLGYLKEQEGKTEEAIKYYIRASEHEDVPLEFQKLIHIDDPGELFDFIIENNEFKDIFIAEFKKIINVMNEILYKKPYSILFGRIRNDKIISKENKNSLAKNINKLFYDGLDLQLI